jgi:L-ascorbate metabolism protein UlaG (beta-lactamase superfamily)
MAVSLTFIGNATVLLRYGELTLLTDPNFLHRGQHAYLGYGLTSRRLREPALSIADLPPLDGVVLSHMHGDHWDRVARNGLDHGLPVVTTPAAARALHRQGFRAARGLQTWESQTLSHGSSSVTVTAVPGQHALGLARRLLPPVMGSVLEFASGATVEHRLYITGDTLYFDGLAEIPNRFTLDSAVAHLGGTTLPGGLVVTMDAAQGVALMRTLDPVPVVPVHYDDYGVFKSPLADFEAAAREAGYAGRVRRVERGQTVSLG